MVDDLFAEVMGEPPEGFQRLDAAVGKQLAADPAVGPKLIDKTKPGLFHLDVKKSSGEGWTVSRYYADRWLWTMVDSWKRVYSSTMSLPEFLDLQM